MGVFPRIASRLWIVICSCRVDRLGVHSGLHFGVETCTILCGLVESPSDFERFAVMIPLTLSNMFRPNTMDTRVYVGFK